MVNVIGFACIVQDKFKASQEKSTYKLNDNIVYCSYHNNPTIFLENNSLEQSRGHKNKVFLRSKDLTHPSIQKSICLCKVSEIYCLDTEDSHTRKLL